MKPSLEPNLSDGLHFNLYRYWGRGFEARGHRFHFKKEFLTFLKNFSFHRKRDLVEDSDDEEDLVLFEVK